MGNIFIGNFLNAVKSFAGFEFQLSHFTAFVYNNCFKTLGERTLSRLKAVTFGTMTL